MSEIEIEHPGHPANGTDAHAKLGTAGLAALAATIRQWASELGFSALTIGEARLPPAVGEGLRSWLAAGCHGDMDYMVRHASARIHPAGLMPNVSRVISARIHYWPDATPAAEVLGNGALAYISRYALGRDYHKVVRARLQKLAERITSAVPANTRVFTDSAPVLEAEFAQRSGLGWRGKHTLLVARDPGSPPSSGSYFFIGEIFIDLPLPVDAPASNHCGRCTACLPACPTGAIIAPYQLDARRCISYLTIEHPGSIPEPLCPLIGNRIYGCDDCQLVCPWNRRTPQSAEKDFAVRNGLDSASLVSLFAWDEAEFLERTAGSPIRRIGHERWLRNIAVALGNAPRSPELLAALRARSEDASILVREHVGWALGRQGV
ncbi:MAG: tRNA epoxyqueuosine(34) reductase QueG [Betaproteobacteria bacterium]|nr:tRNA epoxyqueuosine(34) reductase QueG [Betaproteobacteria bacterium]